MPHHLNEEDLRRHRQLAANSWFPYRKALDDSEGKPLPVSHIDTTVLRAVTEHLHDDDRLTLIGEHLLNSDGYQQPANKDWVFVLPTTVNPPTLPGLEVQSRTQILNASDARETEVRVQQSRTNRMPSAVETPQNPLRKEIWPPQKRNAAFEDDEVRLLGRSGRSVDAAAVPINQPTTRLPMTRVQVNIPNGGPKPRNTLHDKINAQRSHSRPTRDKPRGGEASPLLLRASRGDNVPHGLHPTGLEEAWNEPSQKRQKISHQPSSPVSGSSTDELLDLQDPENVTFGPLPRSRKATSSQSFNSQGSDLQPRRHGSIPSLAEHKKLERMMSSAAPTKKQKRREASQNQEYQHGLPVSPETCSLSQAINISGSDDGEPVLPGPKVVLGSSWRGTARQPPSAANANEANRLAPSQASVAGKISPYFTLSSQPSKQANGTRNQRQASTNLQPSKHKLSYRLDEQFLTVNGTRRSSDINMSSDTDELQLGTTVGRNPDAKAISSTNRRRNNSPSKSSSSTLIALSPTNKNMDPNLDPSNIKRSEFTSAKPKPQSGTLFSGPPVREKKVPWAVDVAAFSKAGQLIAKDGMGLVYDERMQAYVLKLDGGPTSIKILPHKLLKICWENSGRKIRFMSSKTGNEDNLVDLELRKGKDVVELVNRLQGQSACQAKGCSSEHMTKVFEKTRLDFNRSANSDPSNSLNFVDVQRGGGSEPSSPPQADQAKSSQIMETNGRHKPSVVEQLCGRVGAEDPSLGTQPPAQPMPSGLPPGESVSELLARLKPKHNEHLRRSARTSSEFKKPSPSLFDDLGDPPSVERYSKTHNLGEPWKKPLTYPKVGKKKTTVEFSDLDRLDEGEFLNDNLLGFYLRFLEHTLEEQRPDLAKRVYFFNTFFYATLMNTHKGKKGFNYEGVQKWTRNVDLFTYDYIVVPINELSHWYLTIICNLPALDRNLSIGEEDHNAESGFAPEADIPAKLDPPSSSPSRDLAEGDLNSMVDKVKEPDEKGARRSFAEMTLDGDRKSNSADLTARFDYSKSRGAESTNEDYEMLDVPSQDATTSLKPSESESKANPPGKDAEDTVKDPDQSLQAVAKTKKGKRKSGPPAVTKTRPDKPVIITFDSLGMARSSTIRVLKDYLREEAKAKRGGMEFEPGQIKGITATQIPQQDNCYDCGVFLLGYVAKFLEDDPKEFIAKIIRREYDEIKDWPNLRPSTLRNNIRDQVLKLHQDQVAERCQERDAQKNSKPVEKREQKAKQDEKARPSPPRTDNQPDRLGQEVQPAKAEAAEGLPKAPPSAPPATRQEALESALRIGPDDPKKEITTLVQGTEGNDNTAMALQQSAWEIEKQEAKLRALKRDRAGLSKNKHEMPEPCENEASVILVESQSQQDISAPKSFTDSHPALNPVRPSPELPTEIQDSQPSQTSQTFANIVSEVSNEGATQAPKQDEPPQKPLVVRKGLVKEGPPQEVPVVLVEDPRAAKRRKVREEVAAITESSKAPKERNLDFLSWAKQGNLPSRRRKTGRTAQRSDEVINIDD